MIEVSILVNAQPSTVWEAWISPNHMVNWYFASPDWCCPSAELVCREGGTFNIRMEAKDQSFGFDFKGTFTAVDEENQVQYILEDGRFVRLKLTSTDEGTHIIWEFEPENQNPVEFQQQGWQAILTHFKAYGEQTLVA
ncbi:MAG: SRPBCC domain-containing protein [Flavobacteriales bacterium]